jgi:hypothetical protein
MAGRSYWVWFAAGSFVSLGLPGCSAPASPNVDESADNLGSGTTAALARNQESWHKHHGRKHHGHPGHGDPSCDGDDAGVEQDGGSGPGEPDSGDAGGAPGFLRIAQFAPLNNIDFCLRPHGGSEADWTGPILESMGLAVGLQPGDVTAYIPVAPVAQDWRIVRGDATDCTTPFLRSSFSALSPIESGAYRTLVQTGNAQDSYLLFELNDEFASDPGKAKVRFVNSYWNFTSLDLGAGSGDDFVAWTPKLPPAAQATSATYAQGYTQVPAGAGQILTVRSGGNAELAHFAFDLNEGAAITFFPRGSRPDALLACTDNAEPNGALSSCTEVPAITLSADAGSAEAGQ